MTFRTTRSLRHEHREVFAATLAFCIANPVVAAGLLDRVITGAADIAPGARFHVKAHSWVCERCTRSAGSTDREDGQRKSHSHTNLKSRHRHKMGSLKRHATRRERARKTATRFPSQISNFENTTDYHTRFMMAVASRSPSSSKPTALCTARVRAA